MLSRVASCAVFLGSFGVVCLADRRVGDLLLLSPRWRHLLLVVCRRKGSMTITFYSAKREGRERFVVLLCICVDTTTGSHLRHDHHNHHSAFQYLYIDEEKEARDGFLLCS